MVRTLDYRDGKIPEPYVRNTRDNDYTLYVFSAILILLGWCLILYQYKYVETEIIIPCNPGECPTNITTGQKRCPISNEIVLSIDPRVEVCNPSTACTNPRTPYAINPDNSINTNGVCDNNQVCRCVSAEQISGCPFYSEVAFQTSKISLTSFNTYITQINNINPLTGGNNNSISLINNQVCSIGLRDTAKLSVNGCSNTNFSDINDSFNCVKSNPCINGFLTFIPDRNRDLRSIPFNFATERLNTPMSCVNSIIPQSCYSGPDMNCYPVFDWSTATVEWNLYKQNQ